MKYWVLLLAALFSGTASSQWSAGIASISPTRPYIGSDNDLKFFPIVTYEGERLTWRGPFLSYKLLGTKRNEPSWSLVLNLSPNQLDSEDNKELQGIEDRDFSVLAGVAYTHPFDFATFRVAVETDISGQHDGQRLVLGLQRPIAKHPQRKWLVNVGVEVELLTDNYVDYYFGVSALEEANSGFSRYQAEQVVQPSVTVGGYYQFTSRWMLVSNVSLQMLASDIKESPIVNRSSAVNGFVGVVYTF